MRIRFSKDVETSVLVKCKRRCAFCYGIDSDTREQEGQLAHIDGNPANAAEENAAFLCTKHHSRYDSRSKQTKGYTSGELRAYQRQLYEYLKLPSAWWDTGAPGHRERRKMGGGRKGVSLDVYNARVPIYRATVQFVRAVLKNLNADLGTIMQFARETEEAIFLFDEAIAEYLTLLFKQALRIHTIEHLRGVPDAVPDSRSLFKEETDLFEWFSRQFEEVRTRFAPFLHLA